MIRIRVPATSANCCIGFDSMGLALDWKAQFDFEPAESLVITGCPQAYCTEDNLVIQAFDRTAAKYGRKWEGLAMHTSTDVPFARGLGSSSTCVAAGILAADAWFDLHMSDEEKLALATEMEGHPDNAAPALFGGACACVSLDGKPWCARLDLPAWKALAMVPDYEVSTPEARRVLPESLPFKEAVRQTGHALVFEKALEQGNEELLAACCEDRLHEPYRKNLIEEYESLSQAAKAAGLPFWISGSGPTMLALSLQDEKLDQFEKTVRELYPSLQLRRLTLDLKGAEVEHV